MGKAPGNGGVFVTWRWVVGILIAVAVVIVPVGMRAAGVLGQTLERLAHGIATNTAAIETNTAAIERMAGKIDELHRLVVDGACPAGAGEREGG
jgi:hypothetical protein